jgi:hypothetical protein
MNTFVLRNMQITVRYMVQIYILRKPNYANVSETEQEVSEVLLYTNKCGSPGCIDNIQTKYRQEGG